MTEKNYKNAALNRIESTPELSHLSFLKNCDWQNHDSFWETLATSSVEDIVESYPPLNETAVKTTAYHEAGHAVMYYIFGIRMDSANIYKKWHLGSEGEVSCNEKRFPRDANQIFFPYMFSVINLAGPAAEELFHYFDGKVVTFDVLHSVYLCRHFGDESLQVIYAEAALYTINQLFQDKRVTKALKSVGDALIAKGYLTGGEIVGLIEQHLKRGKASGMVRSIQQFVQAEKNLRRVLAKNPNAFNANNLPKFSVEFPVALLTYCCKFRLSSNLVEKTSQQFLSNVSWGLSFELLQSEVLSVFNPLGLSY